MSDEEVEDVQKKICKKYGSPFFASPNLQKVGISANVRDGVWPINGLRHPPEGDTTGWYIWAGEHLSESEDFFLPLHVIHVAEWNPVISKFLGLSPGWRFLVAEDYEDVWYDEGILNI
jgi:hypothetical protein